MDGWQRRVLGLVAAPAALLLAAIGLVPDEPGLTTALPVPEASQVRCVPGPDVRTVADLNRFVTEARGYPSLQGGDVGADALLQDGRRLFVFGDTIRDPGFDGPPFVRNSMLVFDTTCSGVVLPADRGAVVPDRPDGVGYWPMSLVVVPHDGYDLLGVGLQRVRDNGDESAGVYAFDVLGPAVAVFVVMRGRTPQLLEVRDLGPDLVDPERPIWGAAAATVGSTVYLYGTSRPEGGTGGFSLRVARAELDDVVDQSTWEYWDGQRWSAREADAVELIPADGGVSQTLSVFEADGTWYALSKRDEVLGTDLTVWTAPGPTGPFTASPALARIPSDAVTGQLRYMPLAHPDLLPRPGTVVVSYSQNNTDPEVVVDDPRQYRPRFLRVRLP